MCSSRIPYSDLKHGMENPCKCSSKHFLLTVKIKYHEYTREGKGH